MGVPVIQLSLASDVCARIDFIVLHYVIHTQEV
jgi:hypothetical protein